MNFSFEEIAKSIDHSLLAPTLTADELERGIETALRYDVASVCVLPWYVKKCARKLAGSSVKASTTIGFPHGANATAIKVAETLQALADGCEELDAVVNISQVLSGNWEYVRMDIKAVVDIAHSRGQKVKIIFENCYLNNAQKIKLCEICGDVGSDWVKTSTGFGPSGATIEDVKLMREHTPSHIQIKAAGGIRNLDSLIGFLQAGATRIGCSRTAEILQEYLQRHPAV